MEDNVLKKQQQQVLRKLDDEYEMFFMDMMKSTKENLFAKSGEIETKKSIVVFLKDRVKRNKKIHPERMLTSNNILDEFYRYITDHNDISFDAAARTYLKNYTD